MLNIHLLLQFRFYLGVLKYQIDYFESLPEFKSLITALKYLKQEENFKWNDLHSNNLMERPGTKDMVISDPGLFV